MGKRVNSCGKKIVKKMNQNSRQEGISFYDNKSHHQAQNKGHGDLCNIKMSNPKQHRGNNHRKAISKSAQRT